MVRQLEEQHDAEVGRRRRSSPACPPVTRSPPSWSGSCAARAAEPMSRAGAGRGPRTAPAIGIGCRGPPAGLQMTMLTS